MGKQYLSLFVCVFRASECALIILLISPSVCASVCVCVCVCAACLCSFKLLTACLHTFVARPQCSCFYCRYDSCCRTINNALTAKLITPLLLQDCLLLQD
jgi:hypothetical protein